MLTTVTKCVVAYVIISSVLNIM